MEIVPFLLVLLLLMWGFFCYSNNVKIGQNSMLTNCSPHLTLVVVADQISREAFLATMSPIQGQRLDELVDHSVDPCQNLHRFVCPWHYFKKIPPPEGTTERSKRENIGERRTMVGEKRMAVISAGGERRPRADEIKDKKVQKRTIAEQGQYKTGTEKIVHEFLELCQKQQQKKELYFLAPGRGEIHFLKELLEGIFGSDVGGLRLVDPNNSKVQISVPKLWRAIGKIERIFQASGPIVLASVSDVFTGAKTLAIFQTFYKLPREYFVSSEYQMRLATYHKLYIESYTERLAKFADLLDEPIGDARAFVEQFVHTIESFGSMLEPLYQEESRNASIGRKIFAAKKAQSNLTLANLSRRFPHIHWREYLQGNGQDPGQGTRVQVQHPEYLARLDRYMARMEPTRLKNFVLITAISQLFTLRYGLQCEQFLTTYMAHGKGYVYIENVDSEEKSTLVESVRAMIARIVAEYEKAIPKSAWMANRAKKGALAKIRQIRFDVGWPKEYYATKSESKPNETIADLAPIDQYHRHYLDQYRKLGLLNNTEDEKGEDKFENDQTKLWKMMVGMVEANEQQQMESTGPRWGLAPAQINAQFDMTTNVVTLAYGYMEDKYRVPRSSSSTFWQTLANNYGKLGYTVAHEIGHSLDPMGIFFGPNGTYEEWMDQASLAKYGTVQQCIIDTFSRKCCPDQASTNPTILNRKCENGLLTLRENFADISGIIMAYRAFVTELDEVMAKGKLAKSRREDALRQFWLAYGRNYCDGAPPAESEQLEAEFLQNTHSQDECRVNLGTKSAREFGQNLKCKKGEEGKGQQEWECNGNIWQWDEE